jgi:hypothetical protein
VLGPVYLPIATSTIVAVVVIPVLPILPVQMVPVNAPMRAAAQHVAHLVTPAAMEVV